MTDFADWYATTAPENRDAINMLRRALEFDHAFALCIESPGAEMCITNTDDRIVLARMLERFEGRARAQPRTARG